MIILIKKPTKQKKTNRRKRNPGVTFSRYKQLETLIGILWSQDD